MSAWPKKEASRKDVFANPEASRAASDRKAALRAKMDGDVDHAPPVPTQVDKVRTARQFAGGGAASPRSGTHTDTYTKTDTQTQMHRHTDTQRRHTHFHASHIQKQTERRNTQTHTHAQVQAERRRKRNQERNQNEVCSCMCVCASVCTSLLFFSCFFSRCSLWCMFCR